MDELYCAEQREKMVKLVTEKNNETMTKLQDYMEKSLDKIDGQLQKINDSLIANISMTTNIFNRQREQIARTDTHDVQINNLEKSRYGIWVGISMANIVIPVVCSLLGYIYFNDMMTEDKVKTIVEQVLSSKQ